MDEFNDLKNQSDDQLEAMFAYAKQQQGEHEQAVQKFQVDQRVIQTELYHREIKAYRDRIRQLEAILEQIRDIAINNSSSYEMDDIGRIAEKALLRDNPPTNSTSKG